MLASCSIDPVCAYVFFPITNHLHKNDYNTILPAVIKGVESFGALLTPWLMMLMGSVRHVRHVATATGHHSSSGRLSSRSTSQTAAK
jgi:hypothetical protein